MWLVVGLGNPGKAYVNTRHNIGYMVIDTLAKRYSISLRHRRKNFLYGNGVIEDREVILIKPLTFMNRSGIAVKDALHECRGADNLLVVQDDLDLNTGIIRIRMNGSSGGHRGIESIIDTLGTKDFIRLKIGIGRPEKEPTERYVLSRFPKEERSVVKGAVNRAVDAVIMILTEGLSRAQTEFHRG